MSDPDHLPRPNGTAMIHCVALRNRNLLTVSDIHRRSDALIEHYFAPIPGVINLCIPQTRQNKFTGGIDHSGAGRNLHLARAADRRNAVALHNYDGVWYWRTTIPVDQRSTLDDKSSC